MFTDEQARWYRKFEAVRVSGVTNMFDRKMVCELSGLSTDEYMYVIQNYDTLRDYVKSLDN